MPASSAPHGAHRIVVAPPAALLLQRCYNRLIRQGVDDPLKSSQVRQGVQIVPGNKRWFVAAIGAPSWGDNWVLRETNYTLW